MLFTHSTCASASELHLYWSQVRFRCEASQAEAATHAEHLLSSPLQPLSVNISSLAMAENMADLIDGYCRLEGDAEGSFIIRPNKGNINAPLVNQAVQF